MKCLECGREFAPSNHGSPSKYCSGACRAKAYRKRRMAGGEVEEKRDTAPAKPKTSVLTGREFERMMDDSMEDVLRHTRDVLRKAMDDPGTRASDLPALSRQYIAVCRELESQSGGNDLFAADDETMGVSADAGASIV